MLKRLRIRNFKCWQDTGDVKLAPLTLLFGTNSSGKSSIGQFMMMLKQTAEKGDRKSAFYLGSSSKDSYVQLGSYKDVAYHHDLKNDIEFSYDWDLDEVMRTVDFHSEKEYRWNSIFDVSDRKFVAVANAHPGRPHIQEAADGKWLRWSKSLLRHGIVVDFGDLEFARVLCKKKNGCKGSCSRCDG